MNRSQSVQRRIGAGALGGLFATVVMSAGFLAAQRVGAIDKLPPRLIVDRFLPRLSSRSSRVIATVAHLGYGAVAGAAYGALRGRSIRSAVGFGLAVWATSYEFWVPAARVLPPAHRDDRSRAVTIVIAHLIYGFVLGVAMSGMPAGRAQGLARSR